MKGLRLNPRQAGAESGSPAAATDGAGQPTGRGQREGPLSPGGHCAGGGRGRTRSRRTGAGRAHPEWCPWNRSRCQVRGKRRLLRTSGAGKKSGLPAGSRKREPGAAAGPTDSAQAASSALLMGESSAKPTPRKGIKEARSYRIFIKSGVVYRAVWGGGHPRHG